MTRVIAYVIVTNSSDLISHECIHYMLQLEDVMSVVYFSGFFASGRNNL